MRLLRSAVRPALYVALVLLLCDRGQPPAEQEPPAMATEQAPVDCIDGLSQLVALPDWRLHIVDGGRSCTESHINRTFTVLSDGHAIWEEDGVFRTIYLRPEELDAIRALNRFDCVRKEPVGFASRYYLISFPGDDQERAHVHISSSMGITLEHLFDEAMERTARQRLDDMGPVRLSLATRAYWATERWSRRTARYRIEIEDGWLIIRRGRRELSKEWMSSVDLMRVVELLEAGTYESTELEYAEAVGTLQVRDRRIPVRLGHLRYEIEPLARIAYAFENVTTSADGRR